MGGTTFERFDVTTATRRAFIPELLRVPEEHRGGFILNYSDAERDYIDGVITLAAYQRRVAGVLGELDSVARAHSKIAGSWLPGVRAAREGERPTRA